MFLPMSSAKIEILHTPAGFEPDSKKLRKVQIALFEHDDVLLVQPKLDGIRASIKDGVALSKRNKPLPNKELQQIVSSNPGWEGLDLELCHKSLDYNDAQSVVMSRGGSMDAITFNVFDCFTEPSEEAYKRIERAELRVSKLQTRVPCTVLPVKTVKMTITETLELLKTFVLEKGLEGVMCRRSKAPYKFGEGTLSNLELLKLKPFEDYDAEVLSWHPSKKNTNEAFTDERGRTKRSTAKAGMVEQPTLGFLEVRDTKTGEVFTVSSFERETADKFWKQFGTRSSRIALPNAYRFIKYRAQMKSKATKSKKPRHQTFLHFRDARDVT